MKGQEIKGHWAQLSKKTKERMSDSTVYEVSSLCLKIYPEYYLTHYKEES